MQELHNVTQRIPAAHNLMIELSPTRWRLLNGSQPGPEPGPTALFEAGEDGITCAPAFARVRRLPDTDLTAADVARVVVGWAPESASWHLGMLLTNVPDAARRMQWCGLASWPRSRPDDYAAPAQTAGQALASLLARPYQIIPPADEPAVAEDTRAVQSAVLPASRAAPVVPVETRRAPPFTFDDVALAADPPGLVWRRRGRSLLRTAARGVGLLVMALLFLLLGLGTLTSGLASVNPSWLPWLGMAVAGLLVMLALRSFWGVIAATDVVIDRQRGEVRRQSRLSRAVIWRLPFNVVAYVLVSQTPARAQGRRGGAMRIAQDVWLHLSDGQRFWPIAELERVTGLSHDWDDTRGRQKTRGRRRWEPASYDTPAHHAARVTADAIGTDVWLDIR